jgi:hypothetical protein
MERKMAKSLFSDAVRTELRTHHYSLKTGKSYLYWIRLFIFFNIYIVDAPETHRPETHREKGRLMGVLTACDI